MDESNPEQPVVLLIDDSPDVHRLLAARSSSAGYRLLAAYNVPDGLLQCAVHEPDVVLLDLLMPGADGFAALRALKDNPKTMKVPVIVLSGADGVEKKVRAFELGANDFVGKPFNFTELTARVRNASRLSRMLRMLALKSHIDGLTGLKNRAHFDEELDRQLRRRQRIGGSLSLALVDIDHFKTVNDQFGHPVGDAVLEQFARLLATSIRSHDTACRYGGEEFVLILPDTESVEAAKLCDRIRVAVQQMTVPGRREVRVTASFGVTSAAVGGSGMQSTAWIEAADRALYAAKQSGRDSVFVYDAASDQPMPVLRLAG